MLKYVWAVKRSLPVQPAFVCFNDHTIGWQKINLLSHPNATLVLQARQASTSGKNFNYVTLAPQTRQARPSGEFLNYLLSPLFDILVRSLWFLDICVSTLWSWSQGAGSRWKYILDDCISLHRLFRSWHDESMSPCSVKCRLALKASIYSIFRRLRFLSVAIN